MTTVTKLAFLSCSLALLSSTTYAAMPQHVVVAPKCLVSNLDSGYKVLSSNQELAILETSQDTIKQLIKAKNQQQASACGGFIDITQEWSKDKSAEKGNTFLAKYSLSTVKRSSPPAPYPYKIQYAKQVNQLLSQINPADMQSNLGSFSNTHDRHSQSRDGAYAAEWIKQQVKSLAAKYHRSDVSVSTLTIGQGYQQPSVIVKIGKDLVGHGIAIGAHIDTPPGETGRMPGADDNGSGSITVLEAAKELIASGMTFKKPIYLIWYAAEEEGLVGSQQVASTFKQQMIPVDAVLNLDMTGYAYKNDPTLWLITDGVDEDLTNYLELLIKTYVNQPVKRTSCGYACSDHVSWTLQGVAASMAFESEMKNHNPDIHTSQDTWEKLSVPHMTNYAKLAIAFAVELADPV